MRTQSAFASPRPFSDFPTEALDCELHLLLLVAIEPVLVAGFYSLSCALVDVKQRLGDEAPCYNTLRLLPKKLAKLLRLSYGREAELYRTVRFGRRVIGLGADGAMILRLARNYLAEIGRLSQ